MSYVEMKSVVKIFGETEVIHGVDLEIEKEEFTVFVGPSGCGKTTLLRLIAGLEVLNQGAIYIGDDAFSIGSVTHGIEFGGKKGDGE